VLDNFLNLTKESNPMGNPRKLTRLVAPQERRLFTLFT